MVVRLDFPVTKVVSGAPAQCLNRRAGTASHLREWTQCEKRVVEVDLEGLPEIYIQYGSNEAIKSQIEKFIAKGNKEGVRILYDCFSGMNHDFQCFGDLVPQSKNALLKILEFIEVEKTKELKSS